jgi:hypothetical protein
MASRQVCVASATLHGTPIFARALQKKQGKEESYCKARVSRSENKIASYWYHNVLLGMSLNLVMGSKAIKDDF